MEDYSAFNDTHGTSHTNRCKAGGGFWSLESSSKLLYGNKSPSFIFINKYYVQHSENSHTIVKRSLNLHLVFRVPIKLLG